MTYISIAFRSLLGAIALLNVTDLSAIAQPQPVTFADWCEQRDDISEAAKHTVNLILQALESSEALENVDCSSASAFLSASPALRLQFTVRPVDSPFPLFPTESYPNAGFFYLETHQPITDLTPLAPLTNLQEIIIYENTADDISPDYLRPLGQLPRLQRLMVEFVPGSSAVSSEEAIAIPTSAHLDLTPLQNLPSLHHLELRGTRYLATTHLSEITALSTLEQLEILDLSDNLITDLSPLRSLSQLHSLYLNSNRIETLDPLQDLPQLVQIHLDDNHIRDLYPLRSHHQLRVLSLDDNQISDLSPLRSLTGLEWLYLNTNAITEIGTLQDLNQLEMLDLRRNGIRDLSPLRALTNLEIVGVACNPDTDLSPIHANAFIQPTTNCNALEPMYLIPSNFLNPPFLF